MHRRQDRITPDDGICSHRTRTTYADVMADLKIDATLHNFVLTALLTVSKRQVLRDCLLLGHQKNNALALNEGL